MRLSWNEIRVRAAAFAEEWQDAAVSYLIENDLVGTTDERGSPPWVQHWLYKTPSTRRFVRDRS